jgi:hypothetical protein
MGARRKRVTLDRTERGVLFVEDQQIHAEGRLEEMGTDFRQQYGTVYALVEGEDDVTYALKSDTHDLGEYAGRVVRVSGFLVEGFPIEPGGPGYISAVRVEGI